MFRLFSVALGITVILWKSQVGVCSNLDEVLHHYELLEHTDVKVVHHVTKRHAENDQLHHEKTVCFDTLGRHFCLHLQSQRHLFSPTFKVQVVHPGVTRPNYESIDIETEEFYEGYVEGEQWSMVNAYWEDSKSLMANIKIKNETYVIEPVQYHLDSTNNSTASMFSYRASDIKTTTERDPKHHVGPSTCGYVINGVDTLPEFKNPRLDENDVNGYSYLKKPLNHGRYRRQASSAQVCKVALVADYRFTKNVGGSSGTVTAKYLAGVLAEINQIYEKTDFGYGYLGVGFEIELIQVYEKPSSTPEFNKEQDLWDIQPLLESFGRENWSRYCLAHLFTYQGFAGGVQGLAWVASSKSYEIGGICSPVYNGRSYNTGWTSHLNAAGGRILAQEANLVTSHEFGHNWGSPHDPSSCVSSPQQGGKYIMYQYSVSGYDPNNNEFSDCSKSSIGAVLNAKAPNCFKTRQNSYCGNFNVEDTEQCDAGTRGLQGSDPCCTSACKLKSVQCSDANDICCANCQYQSAGILCRNESLTTCTAAAYCSGNNGACPPSAPKTAGDPCIDRGTCHNTSGIFTCKPLCESKGLSSCSCATQADACKYCCKSSSSAECTPYIGDGDPYMLPNGRSCYLGYCGANGECVPTAVENTARFWDVIKDFDINKILAWMKNNIVIATIVISLILYIPLCLVVFCIDLRNSKKDEAEREWLGRENDRLVMDGDDWRIRRNRRGTRNLRDNSHITDNSSEVSAHHVNYQPRI